MLDMAKSGSKKAIIICLIAIAAVVIAATVTLGILVLRGAESDLPIETDPTQTEAQAKVDGYSKYY